MISSAAMSHRLDNLVARDFVARKANPLDGRGVLVQLTDAGADHVDAAMTALAQREAEVLAGVSDADRATLTRLLRTLLDAPVD